MYFEDLKVGMSVETEKVVITKEQMLAFAKEYDPLPLHTDETFAKTTCYKNLIAPGIMSFMAVWAKYAEVDFISHELVGGKTSKFEWFKPVFAEDILVGNVTISSLAIKNAYNGIAELTIKIYNQHNELVIMNVMEVVVKRITI